MADNDAGPPRFGTLPFESQLRPTDVGSRPLRYLLVAELISSQQPMSPGELVRRLQDRGLTITGRPGKTVSDALRWEVAKGRVIKPVRGRYAVGTMPKSTRSWIRRRAATHYDLLTQQKSLPG